MDRDEVLQKGIALKSGSGYSVVPEIFVFGLLLYIFLLSLLCMARVYVEFHKYANLHIKTIQSNLLNCILL